MLRRPRDAEVSARRRLLLLLSLWGLLPRRAEVRIVGATGSSRLGGRFGGGFKSSPAAERVLMLPRALPDSSFDGLLIF